MKTRQKRRQLACKHDTHDTLEGRDSQARHELDDWNGKAGKEPRWNGAQQLKRRRHHPRRMCPDSQSTVRLSVKVRLLVNSKNSLHVWMCSPAVLRLTYCPLPFYSPAVLWLPYFPLPLSSSIFPFVVWLMLAAVARPSVRVKLVVPSKIWTGGKTPRSNLGTRDADDREGIEGL